MASLQTVQKIGRVLDLFTAERPEWGVTEVAVAIGAPRSSAHDLLSALVDTGLLRCRTRGRYRLGWRVVELSETVRSGVNLRSCAAPILEKFVEKYGETTHLAVMDRWNALYVDKIPGTHNITVQGARVGTRLDPHCTAVGKVMLAHLVPSELNRYLSRAVLRRFTSTTITTEPALIEALKGVRSRGFALDEGESVAEVRCVAAPVRDDLGSVVAAVSVSVPVSRFAVRRPELEQATIQVARDITRALAAGYDDNPVALRDTPPTASPINHRAS